MQLYEIRNKMISVFDDISFYIVRYFYSKRHFYLNFFIPLIYLPLLIYYPTQAAKCGYVCLVTATYLITQTLPLAVASLIPVLLYPIMGIMSMKDVSSNYMKDPIMLFFGSLIIAQAIETVNLHRRFALTLLYVSGSKPIWLLLGFLGTTFFISMWINNTATAALMTPIASSVMEEFFRIHVISEHERNVELGRVGGELLALKEKGQFIGEDKPEPATLERNVPVDEAHSPKFADSAAHVATTPVGSYTTITYNDQSVTKMDGSSPSSVSLSLGLMRINKAIFVSIAFAANLGGTASLTGTGPNIVMAGLMNQLFGDKAQISFANWLFYSFPGAFIILCLMWVYMCVYFIGFRESYQQLFGNSCKYLDARPFIKEHLKKVGSISGEEITVSISFTILLCVWILKNPKFMPGWQSWFKSDFVSDSSPAMFVAILYFVLPRNFRSLSCARPKNGSEAVVPYETILTWSVVQKNLMWDIILLFGGGLAIAAGFKSSGLSAVLVECFKVFKDLNPIWTVLLFSLVTSALTEVLSNISTASILVPLMAELAVSVRVHPYYFVFPVTMAASYSFMLPIATGPNAIVYTAGNLSFWDMVKPGFIVNVIGVIVSCISINTYARFVLGTDVFPEWAEVGQNKTLLRI